MKEIEFFKLKNIINSLSVWEILSLYHNIKKSSRTFYQITDIFNVNENFMIYTTNLKTYLEKSFRQRNLN